MARRALAAAIGDEAAAGLARGEFGVCEKRAAGFASSADRGAGGWRIPERFRESRSRRLRIRRRQRRLAGLCGREVGVLSGREFPEWQSLRLRRAGCGGSLKDGFRVLTLAKSRSLDSPARADLLGMTRIANGARGGRSRLPRDAVFV